MVKKKHIYHLQAKPGETGKYVFLSGDPGRIPLISKHFKNAREIPSNRGLTFHSGFLEGVGVAAVSTGIGGPSTAIVVEELIMLGAHTFLRLGTCGSLQKYVNVKDIVISSASIRDEGTSQQYVPIIYPAVAHFELITHLVASSQEANASYHVGITHCKDAFFRKYQTSRLIHL
jgi:uridine phosphorylase